MPYNPTNYKLHLEPDLVNFTFSGTAEILFEAPQPTTEIVLDLLEIDIGYCRFLPKDDFVDCAFNVDSAKEELRITLPEPVAARFANLALRAFSAAPLRRHSLSPS